MLSGAEAALILYSAYIFTMFIVMSNIMVSVSSIYLFDKNVIYLGGSCSR